MSYDVNFGIGDCVYNVELEMCFLDYMSDDELDEYENYWKEQLNEMSKLL